MKTKIPGVIRLSRAEQKEFDKEMADDKRREKATEKAFGKTTIRYLYSVQDACSDLLHFGFRDLKKVRTITVTVAVELENGKKWGRTVSSIPNMPKLPKALRGTR